VKEKVSTDFVEGERRKRFIDLGKTAKASLEGKLKAGESFEQAVAAVATSSGLKLEAKSIPAFSMRNRPQDLDYSVLGTLDRLEKGRVSDMVVSGDKGIFVFATEKQLPDSSEANPRFKETREQIASFAARMGASAYISEILEKELKKSTPQAQ
jgi:peptidyl-prolyl cis-trans isomerase D